MHQVRKATADDVPRLARTLSRAFQDDPFWSWLMPGDSRRPRGARRYFEITLRSVFLGHDEVYTAGDLAAGALWAPPGHWRTTTREALRLMPLAPLVGLGRLAGVLRGLRRFEAIHPTAPHYYLAALGTDPPSQGTGLGSAVLGPVLERCDAEGLPAYLESSKERNIDFYARHGFRVTDVLDMPRGPRTWLMWREPH